MKNVINTIEKVVAYPAGKKFRTVAILTDGTEVVLKKSGAYKPVTNFFDVVVNQAGEYGLNSYCTFNNKIVTTNFWLVSDTQTGKYVKSFNVEQAA